MCQGLGRGLSLAASSDLTGTPQDSALTVVWGRGAEAQRLGKSPKLTPLEAMEQNLPLDSPALVAAQGGSWVLAFPYTEELAKCPPASILLTSPGELQNEVTDVRTDSRPRLWVLVDNAEPSKSGPRCHRTEPSTHWGLSVGDRFQDLSYSICLLEPTGLSRCLCGDKSCGQRGEKSL